MRVQTGRDVKSGRRCVRLVGEIYGGYFACRVVCVPIALLSRGQRANRIGGGLSE